MLNGERINFNVMKPTVLNFKILCQIGYNLTGLSYYNRLSNEWSYELQNGIRWFELFYGVRRDVKSLISDGEVYKFPYYRMDRTTVPFIGNSVNI